MNLWIAKNKHGWVGLYKSKPKLDEDGDWVGNFMGLVSTPIEDKYPELTYDSPQKVKLVLIS